jgi:hypothetical protein
MAYVRVMNNDRDAVLMNEVVEPDHLADEHCSLRIIERIARAVSDADDLEAAARARRDTLRARRGTLLSV